MADDASQAVAIHADDRAQVRREGDDQFIVFPKGFRIDADEVAIHREGERLVLRPVAPAAPPQTDDEWQAFWDEVDAVRGDDQLSLAADEPAESGEGQACR